MIDGTSNYNQLIISSAESDGRIVFICILIARGEKIDRAKIRQVKVGHFACADRKLVGSWGEFGGLPDWVRSEICVEGPVGFHRHPGADAMDFPRPDLMDTARLAYERGCDCKHLPERRRPMQDNVERGLDRNLPEDAMIEADEMYQDASEEEIERPDPDDPTRCRGNGGGDKGVSPMIGRRWPGRSAASRARSAWR